MRRDVRTDWSALMGEVRDALQQCGRLSSAVRINGKLRRMGSGLNHDNYVFRLSAHGRPAQEDSTIYVLRKLGRDRSDALHDDSVRCMQNEARTLQTLATQRLNFLAPEFVCFVGSSEASPSGFVETALPGLSCEHMVGNKGHAGLLVELRGMLRSGKHEQRRSQETGCGCERRDRMEAGVARWMAAYRVRP